MKAISITLLFLLATGSLLAQSQPPSLGPGKAGQAQHPSGVDRNTISEKKQHKAPPNVVESVNRPEAKGGAIQGTKHADQETSKNWWPIANSGLTLLLLAVQVGVYLWMARTMRGQSTTFARQAEANIVAAEAARKSAEVAERSLNDIERPLVFPTPFQRPLRNEREDRSIYIVNTSQLDSKDLYGVEFWYECENVGRSPAIMESITVKHYLVPIAPSSPNFEETPIIAERITRILGNSSANNKHEHRDRVLICSLRDERELADCREGQMLLLLSMKIGYSDAFGKSHCTIISFRYNFAQEDWERWGDQQWNSST